MQILKFQLNLNFYQIHECLVNETLSHNSETCEQNTWKNEAKKMFFMDSPEKQTSSIWTKQIAATGRLRKQRPFCGVDVL